MNCQGLGQRGGFSAGGGRSFGSAVFATPSFGSFLGSRFNSPFNVWPWDGWNNPWPWSTWYLYYPEYYPLAQQCAVGNIRLTQDQTQRIAAGQTVQIAVTNTCGQLVTVTLGGGSSSAMAGLGQRGGYARIPSVTSPPQVSRCPSGWTEPAIAVGGRVDPNQFCCVRRRGGPITEGTVTDVFPFSNLGRYGCG